MMYTAATPNFRKSHKYYNIKHSPYSPTKLSDFLRCPKFWEFKYIKKKKTLPGPALKFGSAFHEFAKEISHFVFNNDQRMGVSRAEIENHVYRISKKLEISNPIITKMEDKFIVCRNNIIDFLVNLSRGSWDNVEIEGKKLVDKNYNPTITRNNAYLLGKLDLLLISKSKALIVDWKTGRKSLTPLPDEEMQVSSEELQADIYSLLVFEWFPKISEVKIILFYAGDESKDRNKKINFSLSQEKVKEIKEKLDSLIRKIETCQEFFPRPWRYCNRCDFKTDCKLA